jgi:hypothetical protein
MKETADPSSRIIDNLRTQIECARDALLRLEEHLPADERAELVAELRAILGGEIPERRRQRPRGVCGPVRDLTGLSSGRLTVLYVSPEKPVNGNTRWICRCECGNVVSVIGYKIVTGRAKSCGCIRRHPKRPPRVDADPDLLAQAAESKAFKVAEGETLHDFLGQDLAGKQFGYLTAETRAAGVGRANSFWWNCRCACDGYAVVNSRNLLNGKVRSCGCKKVRSGSTRQLPKGPKLGNW